VWCCAVATTYRDSVTRAMVFIYCHGLVFFVCCWRCCWWWWWTVGRVVRWCFPRVAQQLDVYKNQAKRIFKQLNITSPPRCTIESGPYCFQLRASNERGARGSVMCRMGAVLCGFLRACVLCDAARPPFFFLFFSMCVMGVRHVSLRRHVWSRA